MRRIALCVSFVAVAALWGAPSARADEGMYPLDGAGSLPAQRLEDAGIEVSVDEILTLRRAVAKVAGGGSGSFVSDSGLLVTNHHVAYRCLAALDGTEEHAGIMERGFVAHAAEAEIPCPGYDLMVVEDVRDVTGEVRAALEGKKKKKKKGHARFEAIRLGMEALEEECQSSGADLFCDVEPLDGGRLYHMAVYRLIRDVRLVYAPEKDIGKFGGDVDNWRFPRHTGDYSFLRAYVDEKGTGAPYSGSNVPYRPAAHLEVSTEGVSKGSPVLVMGFPARTKRNYPAASARFALGTDMPKREAFYRGLAELLEEISAADDLAARRYQGLDASLRNAIKYYEDSMAGFEKWGIVDKLEARDRELKARLELDPAVRRKYGRVLPGVDSAYARYEKVFDRFFVLQRLGWIAKSFGTAFDIAMWTRERVKPDERRTEDRYKTKNMYKVIDASDNLDDQIAIEAEKALLLHVLREAEALPEKQRLKSVKRLLRWGKKELPKVRAEARAAGEPFAEHYRELTGGDFDGKDPLGTAVDLAYARTAILARGDDRDERERALYQRRRLFYNDVREARKTKDPLIDFARAVAAEYLAVKNGPFRVIEETFDTELRPMYAEALDAPYPDANFQVRLSHGAVDDYTATEDGKTHRYITDLAGVLAKDEGKYPFNAPEGLKRAAAGYEGRFADPEIGDVPVDFTCTLDTTGGNSGSPVLDARGRLVGLLFDGTPESILSDWQFLPDDQRSIVLDIRYALFLAEAVHGAKRVLEEILPAADE